MLLWQRKSKPKHAFAFRIACLIIVVHLLILCILCISSMGVYGDLSVVASQQYLIGADILVVPFQKPAPKKIFVPQKPVSQPIRRETSVVQDVQAPIKKNIPDQKKQTPKPTPIPEKPKAQQQVPAAAKPAEQPKVTPEVLQQQISTHEMRTMHIQQAIVEQLQQHWQPPAGLQPESETILVVRIDCRGNINEIQTQQSSGIFAYDVQARSAVYAMQFPKACWGSMVTIAFT